MVSGTNQSTRWAFSKSISAAHAQNTEESDRHSFKVSLKKKSLSIQAQTQNQIFSDFAWVSEGVALLPSSYPP